MKCLFVLLLNFLVFSSVYAANFIYVDWDASQLGFYRFYTQEGDLGSALGAGGNLYVLTVNNIGAHPLIFGSYGTLYDGDVVTFTADEDIDYSCLNHPFMSGTLSVSWNGNITTVEALSSYQTNVNIISHNGVNVYTLNDNISYVEEYGIYDGVYTFKSVPETHPIAIVDDSGFIEYHGTLNNKVRVASGRDYYYGDVTIKVTGDFGNASLACAYHGAMGGTDMLVYGSEYELPSQLEYVLNTYTSEDLSTWDLSRTESVYTTESKNFMKTTLDAGN
tara:strand:+ start:1760 stop:2590 length:831 start_codon:yes stop_codon:yes gene_type:complete